MDSNSLGRAGQFGLFSSGFWLLVSGWLLVSSFLCNQSHLRIRTESSTHDADYLEKPETRNQKPSYPRSRTMNRGRIHKRGIRWKIEERYCKDHINRQQQYSFHPVRLPIRGYKAHYCNRKPHCYHFEGREQQVHWLSDAIAQEHQHRGHK